GFLYQQSTLRDALVAGLHFDIFHRHAERLVMANIAQTVNVLQAMILTDEESGALVLTPTYHVFEMNQGHQDATSLAVHLIEQPAPIEVDNGTVSPITATASTKDGAVLISAGNLSLDQAAVIDFDLRGAAVRTTRARVLTADKPQAHNTTQQPDAVAPKEFEVSLTDGRLRAELPPHAFATVELALA